MTKGRKLRPRWRCFAPGRTPFEQWINSRRGFDISISRFVVDETAIVKQAIEAMSTLRTLRRARLVQRPSIRKATDNGSALGPPGSPSRLGSNPGQSADAMSALFIGRDHVIVAGVDSLHFLLRQVRELILEIEHALRPEAVEHGNLADCPRSESRADAIARCPVERYTGDIGAVELIPIGACWLTSERC